MKIPLKALISACVCALLFASTGCKKDDKFMENAHIPRLLIEKRGVNYGSISGKELRLPVSGTPIRVEKDPLINEFDIRNVELVKVDLGMALMLQMTERGGRELYRASVSNNGSRIVLTVNNNAIGARRIDGAMADGDFFTFVEVPDEDLGQLVLDIKETLNQLQARKNSGW